MSQNYNQGFIYKARQTVYKWWCIVYRPAYKLFHHGYWPAEKEPYYIPPDESKKNELAEQESKPMDTPLPTNDISSSEADSSSETEISTDNIDSDVLDRANEIMKRLAREAAEDEALKQAEIDNAKKIAAENERLAEIMNANKVDISAFIEEGRANQKL